MLLDHQNVFNEESKSCGRLCVRMEASPDGGLHRSHGNSPSGRGGGSFLCWHAVTGTSSILEQMRKLFHWKWTCRWRGRGERNMEFSGRTGLHLSQLPPKRGSSIGRGRRGTVIDDGCPSRPQNGSFLRNKNHRR